MHCGYCRKPLTQEKIDQHVHERSLHYEKSTKNLIRKEILDVIEDHMLNIKINIGSGWIFPLSGFVKNKNMLMSVFLL